MYVCAASFRVQLSILYASKNIVLFERNVFANWIEVSANSR